MRLWLAIITVLLFAPLTASAQVSVYGKVDYNHHTDNNNSSSHSLFGGSVGIEDDFLHGGPLSVGIDICGSFQSGDHYRYRSLLLGLPVRFKLPLFPIRPYVGPVIGVGGAKQTDTAPSIMPSYTSKLTYGFVTGANLTVLPHVDWRVLEVGYTREKNGVLADPNILVSSGLGVRF